MSPRVLPSAVAVIMVSVAPGLIGACGGAGSSVRPHSNGSVTINVPGNAKSISAAVAAARPGDLVLVHPGTYRETVAITKPDVTLRGTDRNRVIIDGQVLRPNGIVVTAARVTVQNLTVRNAVLNGVLITGMRDADGGVAKGSDGYSRLDPAKFPPLKGYRVDHVTSYNNGLYGIYAFDARDGLITDTFTSGMADSGLYVGQCKPCDTVVSANVAERNAVGYEGTNAGGDLLVVGNRFVGNRVGATVDSDYQEAFIPQARATLAGNLIAANNEASTPEQAEGGFGLGLGVAGGTDNVITRNTIVANSTAGMIIASSDDLAPKWNKVIGNTFAANSIDVSYSASKRAPGVGNCFSDNVLTKTSPGNLAEMMTCPGRGKAIDGAAPPKARAPKGIGFTDVAAPRAQPDMSDPESARVTRIDIPRIDLASVAAPSSTLLADRSSIRW